MKVQESIRAILLRELHALQREIEAYESEESIWAVPPGIANSAGTLVLHLAGNLQSFVGAVLGDTGYVRDRKAEFQRRGVSRTELLTEIEKAIESVDTTLTALDDGSLNEPFPLVFGALQVTAGDFLIHLTSHLAFHVGQIDYHRRLVTGDSTSIGPVPIPDLASAQTHQ